MREPECEICGEVFVMKPKGRAAKSCPDCRAKKMQSPYKELTGLDSKAFLGTGNGPRGRTVRSTT